MTDTVYGAYTDTLVYAARAHDGQTRRYSGAPYITHPIRVASLVHQLWKDERYKLLAMQIALLHDVIEDTTITYGQVSEYFNPEVAQGVWGMTNAVGRGVAEPVRNNRAERKAMDQEWLRVQTPLVRAVKLLDIADNLTETDPHDSFMGVFLAEVGELAPVLLKDLTNTYNLGAVVEHYGEAVAGASIEWELTRVLKEE